MTACCRHLMKCDDVRRGDPNHGCQNDLGCNLPARDSESRQVGGRVGWLIFSKAPAASARTPERRHVRDDPGLTSRPLLISPRWILGRFWKRCQASFAIHGNPHGPVIGMASIVTGGTGTGPFANAPRTVQPSWPG